MFYIIYCFWASYFFACLRGVARSLGTQYFVSLFACAGVARPLVNHIHHLYFHGFLSGFPISSSITNCIIIVIISGSSMSSGSGSGSGSSSSSNSSSCCYCCCEWDGRRELQSQLLMEPFDIDFGLVYMQYWYDFCACAFCLCFCTCALYLCSRLLWVTYWYLHWDQWIFWDVAHGHARACAQGCADWCAEVALFGDLAGTQNMMFFMFFWFGVAHRLARQYLARQ